MQRREDQSASKGAFEATGRTEADARLLTAEAAAHYLGVTVWAVRRWVSQRRIAYVKIGRLTRFDRRDLDELIERMKVHPGPYPLSSTDLNGAAGPGRG